MCQRRSRDAGADSERASQFAFATNLSFPLLGAPASPFVKGNSFVFHRVLTSGRWVWSTPTQMGKYRERRAGEQTAPSTPRMALPPKMLGNDQKSAPNLRNESGCTTPMPEEQPAAPLSTEPPQPACCRTLVPSRADPEQRSDGRHRPRGKAGARRLPLAPRSQPPQLRVVTT